MNQTIEPGETYLVEADPTDLEWDWLDVPTILAAGGNVTVTVGGCAVLTLLATDYKKAKKHPCDATHRRLKKAGLSPRTLDQIAKERRRIERPHPSTAAEYNPPAGYDKPD